MTDQEILKAMSDMLAATTVRLESKLQTLDDKVSTLDSKVSALDDKVSTLDRRVSTLENEVSGIKVLMDTEFRRNESLLAEGQEIILERLTALEGQGAMEARLSAVEAVVTEHSRQIHDLKMAQ